MAWLFKLINRDPRDDVEKTDSFLRYFSINLNNLGPGFGNAIEGRFTFNSSAT
jgi:hypothetical protein